MRPNNHHAWALPVINPQPNRQDHQRGKMSIPRLTFLYPHIFKSIRACEPTVAPPLPKLRRASQKQLAGFHNSARSGQDIHAQRYGTATEGRLPPPPPPLPYSLGGGPALETKPEQGEAVQAKQEGAEPELGKNMQESSQDGPDDLKTTKPATLSTDSSTRPRILDAAESHPKEPPEPVKEGARKPLETFLTIKEPPPEENSEEHKPPHLQPPPYVHHFDTYTLVRDVEKGGFTMDQSVTLMKAVRSLLALNLDVAKEGLVSKSDIENVCILLPLRRPALYVC